MIRALLCPSRRGFTLIETAACVVVASVATAVALQAGTQPARDDSRRKKDQSQVRAILQSLIIWGQNNRDRYPLPSEIDRTNDTLADQGAAKDTSANIYSLLVYAGFILTETLVSPVENNPNVVICETYQFDKPAGAVRPEHASWDPKFSAALDAPRAGERKGNVSYAHLQPAGKRRERWALTNAADQLVVGTRGPQIKSAVQNPEGTVTPTLANPASNTLKFFGAGSSWSGFQGYNAGHVSFSKDSLANGRVVPRGSPVYTANDGKIWPDLWSHDEQDDTKGGNAYLGIFLKAGETPANYTAAWD